MDMEKLVALCRRRGFIFQSSESYGGINGFWDNGPLGVDRKSPSFSKPNSNGSSARRPDSTTLAARSKQTYSGENRAPKPPTNTRPQAIWVNMYARPMRAAGTPAALMAAKTDTSRSSPPLHQAVSDVS